MEYENLEQLKREWLNGTAQLNFDPNSQMNVGGIPYSFRSSYKHDFKDIIGSGVKPFVIFHTNKPHWENAKQQGLDQWLVFVWDTDNTNPNVIIPNDIVTTSERHFGMYAESHVLNGTKLQEQTDYIGDVVILKIHLPSGTCGISGKVDTGADISSLHAENIEIVGDTVRFVNTELSSNKISAQLKEKQAVKSADGGISNRPVIELDCEINGKPIRNALFNLNDRDQMEYQCLIGQNILEKTNFLIDPNHPGEGVKESIETEFDLLQSFILDELNNGNS